MSLRGIGSGGIVPPYVTRRIAFAKRVDHGLQLATTRPLLYRAWAASHPVAARVVNAKLHTNPGPLPPLPDVFE
ncbi:MAG: hypothetical protein IPJ65_16665 [Archangiaceae bacterium]|nr:hypothetical protein [Archangiaceae bacterium]